MLLEEVKEYLRVYDNHSDALIQAMIDGAIEVIEGATGNEFKEDNLTELEKLCVKLLVKHWYDNETEDVPFGIQTIMTQLEY